MVRIPDLALSAQFQNGNFSAITLFINMNNVVLMVQVSGLVLYPLTWFVCSLIFQHVMHSLYIEKI